MEAGFVPNKFQSAFSEELLLEKFASLIRELQHFPVVAEVQMKAHNDHNFPNEKTFNRLGPKHEFAAKLVDFCQNRPGYENVADICRPLAVSKTKATDRVKPEADVSFGEIYLLRFGRHYKIGRTNAVGRRERELAIQLPKKTTLVHVIKTDDPVGIESYWHRRFEGRRKNGEWFELTPEDVAAFRRRKFM